MQSLRNENSVWLHNQEREKRFGNIADVLRLGDKTNEYYPFLKEGQRIIAPVKDLYSSKQLGIEEGHGIISPASIRGYIINGTVYAKPGHILVKRNIEEEKTDSGLIIPYGIYCKDQTLTGWISAFSFDRKYKNVYGLAKNDFIQIEKWDMEIIELLWNGEYHLSVPEKLITFHTKKYKPKWRIPCKGCGEILEECFTSYCYKCKKQIVKNN